MAPRLAVVVSQAPMRDARTADIEESIVAELIMVGGLDATLVGPLEHIQPDSTDRLCLSGFTQNLALLSWMPAAEAGRLWQELELAGTVVPLSLDGSAGVSNGSLPGRRIFYIQLTAESVPKQVCKQLQLRLELMRVQPVSLQLNLSSPIKTSPKTGTADAGNSLPSSALPARGKPLDFISNNATPVIPNPMPDSGSNSGANSLGAGMSPLRAGGDEAGGADGEWKNLDRLVDDLDALDL